MPTMLINKYLSFVSFEIHSYRGLWVLNRIFRIKKNHETWSVWNQNYTSMCVFDYFSCFCLDVKKSDRAISVVYNNTLYYVCNSYFLKRYVFYLIWWVLKIFLKKYYHVLSVCISNKQFLEQFLEWDVTYYKSYHKIKIKFHYLNNQT